MKKAFRLFIVLGSIWATMGCATIMIRGPSSKNFPGGPPVYRATILDVGIICSGGGLYKYFGQSDLFVYLVALPFTFADLPVSLVVDTLCFPVDLIIPPPKKELSPSETVDKMIKERDEEKRQIEIWKKQQDEKNRKKSNQASEHIVTNAPNSRQ